LQIVTLWTDHTSEPVFDRARFLFT